MANSNSTNDLSRSRNCLLIAIFWVVGAWVLGWGCTREGEPPEDQGEKSVSQAGIMTYYREVEPARQAISSVAGPGAAFRSGRVESGESFWAEGDLSEAAGIDDAGTLQRENDALRRENFRMQERLEGMAGYGERDKAQAASSASGESEILAEELLVKQEEIENLTLEKEQLEEDFDEIVGIANRLEEEVAELEAEGRGLSAEDYLLLQDEIDNLRRENGRLVDRIGEFRAIIEKLQDELSGMESEGIAVIAPSEETWEIAEQILMRMGQEEIPPKQAESVLVVVFSDLDNPLSYSYNLYGELVLDANRQMEIEALMYHAYIYQINDDLSVEQVEHTTGYYE